MIEVDPWDAERTVFQDTLGAQVSAAIRDRMLHSERTEQAQDHILGPSDIGGCREYVRRMIVQMPFTDERVTVMPAFIGTAVGALLEESLKAKYPELRTQLEVEIEMPSGLTLRGHPDIITPNAVIDGKTVDGLGVVRRTGPTDQQWYQVTMYALGLIQAGELPEDCWVALVFIDRSGDEEEPVVFAERFSMDRIAQADDWLADVIYAVRNAEPASKDKPREWCWAACPYATDCRGTDTDVQGLIADPFTLNAVDVLLDAKGRKKAADKDIKSAQSALKGVEGSTGSYTVRWVEVPETEISAGKRAGYRRLDVKPVRRKK